MDIGYTPVILMWAPIPQSLVGIKWVTHTASSRMGWAEQLFITNAPLAAADLNMPLFGGG